MKVQGPLEGDEATSTWTLVGLLASGVLGCGLFVVLWAGLNFGFGSALDGPIGAFVVADHWTHLSASRPPSLASGEAFARTGAERRLLREHRTAVKTKPEARIGGRGHQLK